MTDTPRFEIFNGGEFVKPIMICADIDDGKHAVISFAVPGFCVIGDTPKIASMAAYYKYAEHLMNAIYN